MATRLSYLCCGDSIIAKNGGSLLFCLKNDVTLDI